MSAEVLLFLLFDWQPLPCCPPPGFAYDQLPTEKICELCFHQCEADERELTSRLELVGGWSRHQLLEQREESQRLAQIWYAAWWVTWNRATPAQQQEWSNILAAYVGDDIFWSGQLPLPLGAR